MVLPMTVHRFTDWKGAAGQCEVRVFPPTDASGDLPVVIVTETDDNRGPSVTNAIEQIAAEVLTRHVPQQDGAEPPFVLVEHYADRARRGEARRYHDPFFGETFDVVTFSSWTRKRAWRRGQDGGIRWFEQVKSMPEWRHVDRAEVERLVGQPLPWPVCTCETARA